MIHLAKVSYDDTTIKEIIVQQLNKMSTLILNESQQLCGDLNNEIKSVKNLNRIIK